MGGRSTWQRGFALASLGAAAAVLALVALAAQGEAAVINGNPLERIYVNRLTPLDCQVEHIAAAYTGSEASGEFWGQNHCGTWLHVDGFGPFGPSLVGNGGVPVMTATAFTMVSQTTGGTGTLEDPKWILTHVTASGDVVAPFSYDIQQRDSYIDGREDYLTSIQVTNTGSSTRTLFLARGGDCYLPGGAAGTDESDQGYGFLDVATRTVACTSEPSGQDGRIIGWIPHTAGATVEEGWWDMPYEHATDGEPFGNTCTCGLYIDNGGGIGWQFTLAPGESATFDSDNVFAFSIAAPLFSVQLDGFPLYMECLTATYQLQADAMPAWGFESVTWTIDGVVSDHTGDDLQPTWPRESSHTVAITGVTIWGETLSESLTIDIPGMACPPTMDPIPPDIVGVGEPVQACPVAYAGPADGVLTFTVLGMPAGMEFDGACASWIPRAPYVHPCIRFTVHEAGQAGTAERCWYVRVDPPRGPPEEDRDGDGVADITDNCAGIPNRAQADADSDGVGDACDDSCGNGCDPEPDAAPQQAGTAAAADSDGDGAPDATDNCPGLAARDQADLDRDGQGDACDADLDGDGVAQAGAAGLLLDVCPRDVDPRQRDRDGDGVGDACDADPAAPAAAARPPAGAQAQAAEAPAWMWLALIPVAVAALVAGILVARKK